MVKTFWRCFVCGDIHYGNNPPLVCPTCFTRSAYCKIDDNEAANVLFWRATLGNKTNEEGLVKIWGIFTKENDFKLNPETEMVETVAKGINENERKYGLKLCPCRLRDGTRKRDLELICPCNFKIQDTWVQKGMCWCGLFVKR